MNFIKILKINQRNLDKDRKVINVNDENKVKWSSYNFLIKTLEIYNNRMFENDEFLNEFIICNLPKSEKDAYKQWFGGIECEGKKYYGWFATINGMKQEDWGICDTIFIREDYREFAEMLENLISLGKFKELENKKQEICINKDVLSRISLATSDLITKIDMPNFIVLPSANIDWIRDYKTVEPHTYIEKKENSNGEVEEVERMEYELIDYHFDTNKKDEDGGTVDTLDVFDGGGIATPTVFKNIGNSLGRTDVEFAIIRGYGIAVKGLITKFDIIKYLNTLYKGDTPYCRKNKNGEFELLDRWGDWQIVTENTMLLNDSMVKLAKYFKNMEQYRELLKSDKYALYHNLMNKLYITKVNKTENEIKNYRRTNYQLINALALTPKAYSKLIKQDIKLFNKILKPYTYVAGEGNTKEFVANIDYINLFYKQCVGEEINENDKMFEKKVQEKMETVVDKVHELLNISPQFVKLNYVKRNLRNLIEKRVRDLCSGKVTVKAKYQYIGIDPISYMNFAMTRGQGENGLKKGEFYSGDCNNGDIRTISRNPLSAYSEVHNIKFVRNPFLDNWLSSCKELIYFNQKSDILSLLSSADCDGDAVTQIDNEIIRNAVVIPKDSKYFITKNDGKKKYLSYNKENRFISTYRASGNLIGQIALKAANVNSNCQVVPDYYDVTNKKFINYMNFKNDMEFDEHWSKEKVDKHIQNKIESKEWVKGYSSQVENELKAYIKEKYFEYEKDIYIVLYNSMCAIDAPKTLVFPSKKEMEVLNSRYYNKVNWLQYKENKEDVNLEQYFYRKNNLLDFFSITIQKDLSNGIEDDEDNKKKFRDRVGILQKIFKNEQYCKETYDLCFKEIKKLYKKYTDERTKAINECSKNIRKLCREYHELSEIGMWGKFEDEEMQADKRNSKKEKYKKFKEIDTKYFPVANKIMNDFDIATICQCISKLDKCTENFILSLFWRCFSYVNDNLNNVRYVYKKNTDGEIEYLYEKYKRIEVNNFNNKKVVGNIEIDDSVKLNINKKVRFRLNDKSIISEIEDALKAGKYELKLSDNRIQVFNEFEDFVKDKDVVNIIKIDKVNEKSLGLICEGI